MTDKPPRPSLMVVAFGVAILAATFRAMQVGLWDTTNVFAFAIAYGSTLVLGYGVLSGPVAFTGMLADSQANLTEKAKHIHTAKTLGEPQVGQAGGATVDNANPQAEAWYSYWLDAIAYSEEVGGLTYRQMQAFFSNGKAWEREFVTPLIFAGYITPRSSVNPNAATVWAEDWTAERVRWRIENRIGLPPTPPYAPPVKFPKQDTPITA